MVKRGSDELDQESSSRPAKISPIMTRSAAAVQALENEENAKLLQLIDNYRELELQEQISLPQLVVVGDQSSGKSSLLEGITGFSFPTGSGLCTRFATQIILKRTSEGDESMTISIMPGPAAKEDAKLKEHLQAFDRRLEGNAMGDSEIAKLLDEAAVHMGLPPSTAEEKDLRNLPKRFSDDVLRIELSGPDYPRLSVVDVPGLFHKSGDHQTTEDMVTIKTMIQNYANDKRTIILAVMDGRVNIANQGVFEIARNADHEGLRTVGVITKLDAIGKGDEDEVMQIAQNRRDRLALGFFVVKNRSTQEIKDGVDLKGRNDNEAKFFKSTAPWKNLPKDRVGVPNLTAFLAERLHAHIKDEFPHLLGEIRDQIEKSSTRLEDLGAARGTPLQQRQYLNKIAGAYERHVNDATTGNYKSSYAADDARKLRMHVADEKEVFGKHIAQRGHLHAFLNPDGSVDEEYGVTEKGDGTVAPSSATGGRSESVYEWIQKARRESRGTELPGSGLNPVVLQNLFRQQAAAWEQISIDYVGEVDAKVASYNEAALKDVVKDDTVRKRLAERIDKAATAAYRTALAQLDDLLQAELGGILQTENNYYAENLVANRRARILHRLKGKYGDAQVFTTTMAEIDNTVHLSIEEFANNDCHDILNAYYKVARKRFVDYVVIKVIEPHYVGPNGLVHFFNTEYVGGLSDRELAEIAGENARQVMDREIEAERLEKLQKALELGEAI